MAQANVIYSDFTINFDPHPVTGDLIRFVNDAAVKRAVRAIIFTNRGERFFQPNFGSGIKKLLFEPMTPQTTLAMKKAIEDSLKNFEPRVSQLNINVSPDYPNEAYNVSIQFFIINIVNPVILNLTLERLR